MLSIPVAVEHVAIRSTSPASKGTIVPALLAAGLGLVLLYGAAFADVRALHDAAHDGRHAAGFPCH